MYKGGDCIKGGGKYKGGGKKSGTDSDPHNSAFAIRIIKNFACGAIGLYNFLVFTAHVLKCKK